MKHIKSFILLLIVITSACTSKLSQKKVEEIIIGTWQITPYPKPSPKGMNELMYQEMIALSSPIVTFTKNHEFIDSSQIEEDEIYPEYAEKIFWRINPSADVMLFRSDKENEELFWEIQKINQDTLLLYNISQKKYLLFLSKIARYQSNDELLLILPPRRKDNTLDEFKMKDRNVFSILINSKNQILAEEEPTNLEQIRSKVKAFVSNRGKGAEASENPQKASITFKTDRTTSYAFYVRVLDEIKAAYNELQAEYLGISLNEFLQFDEKSVLNNPELVKKAELFSKLVGQKFSVKEYLRFNPNQEENKNLVLAYHKARASSPDLFIEKYYDATREYPLRISEAVPTGIGE